MNEEEIGYKAAAMLQSALRNETSRFSRHIRNDDNALRNATAEPVLPNSNRKEGYQQKYLRGLKIKMHRHGFVLHYGIESGRLRKSHQRTRHKPRETKYRVEAHLYRKGQKEQPFIDKVVNDSQVLDYLATAISQARGEEIVTYLARGLENKSWVISRQLSINVAQILIEGGKGSVPSDEH